MSASHDITPLLRRFREGDEAARAALISAVYDELKMMAQRYMRRERQGHTLQATALVNEAYVRLVNIKKAEWRDRAHFFAVAAQVMRGILVDHARKHLAGRRGGGMELLPINEEIAFAPGRAESLVRLDESLTRLSQLDPRVGRIIELRFFGGLSIEETSELMQISPRTVKREWSFGRAWLRNELKAGGLDGSSPLG
jgi:RNA polymerase sigma factor (TIGR02999 family)